MKQRRYTNEPPDVDLDNAKRIKDFLSPPEELVFKETNTPLNPLSRGELVKSRNKEEVLWEKH
jgi:hypothetical protein